MLRIDAPPSAVRGWVMNALELSDVTDQRSVGDHVVGVTPENGRVVVQFAAPMGLPSTLVGVTTVPPAADPHTEPPGDFMTNLSSVVPERATVERILEESDAGSAVSTGWAALGREPAVSATGRYSLGEPVYEIDVQGRVVSAELVRTDAALGAVQAAVGTPLRSVRRGTGGEYYVVGDEVVRDAFGESVLSRERMADLLGGLDVVGTLVVDDRLGVVRHVLDPFEDPERLHRQAEAVVAVARAVEDDT